MPQNWSGIADQADGRFGNPIDFFRIDINPHDLNLIVEPPGHLLRLQPRTNRQYDIRVAPEDVTGGQGMAELMAIVEHPAPVAKGNHWGLQEFRQGFDLLARVERPTADDNQGIGGLPQFTSRLSNRIVVDGRGIDGDRRGIELGRGGLRPEVHRAF